MPSDRVAEAEAMLDAHEISIEGWAEFGWNAVATLCRFHAQMGAPGLNRPLDIDFASLSRWTQAQAHCDERCTRARRRRRVAGAPQGS
jgi:hypothetical protein